jgi:hypothetical protein
MDCWGSGWLVPVPLYCQNFKLDRHLRCLFICLLFYTLILLLLPCLSLVCFFCYVLYTWYTHLMRYWWISNKYTRDWLLLGSLRPTLSIVLKIRTLSLIVLSACAPSLLSIQCPHRAAHVEYRRIDVFGTGNSGLVKWSIISVLLGWRVVVTSQSYKLAGCMVLLMRKIWRRTSTTSLQSCHDLAVRGQPTLQHNHT